MNIKRILCQPSQAIKITMTSPAVHLCCMITGLALSTLSTYGTALLLLGAGLVLGRFFCSNPSNVKKGLVIIAIFTAGLTFLTYSHALILATSFFISTLVKKRGSPYLLMNHATAL